MNFVNKILCAASLTLFSSTAFALVGMNRIDALGFGGYSQADQWSDSNSNNINGTMSGFNGGGMLLVSLGNRMVNPVIGAGIDYMQLTSTQTLAANSASNSNAVEIKASNTLISTAGTGHFGLRISGPFIRFFLLGNAGYGLSDSFKIDYTVASSGSELATYNYKMKNHTFYGGTAAFLVSAAPFLKIGVMGVYNMHTATFEDKETANNTPDVTTNYQEVSGNLVIDFNF